MAACLITNTGSGKALLTYVIGGNVFTLKADGGLFYIDDTATSVFYTTIEGNLVLTSGCLTVTNLPYQCALLEWANIEAEDHQIEGIRFNGEDFFFANPPDFPLSGIDLAAAINSVNDDRFKVISFKRNQLTNGVVNCSYLLRTIGAEEVGVIVENDNGDDFIILAEFEETCSIPEDHVQVYTCDSSILD